MIHTYIFNHLRPENYPQVDKHGRGWLSHGELFKLCTLIIPDISPGQLRYLEVMLDHDGDGMVSFQDLQVRLVGAASHATCAGSN